MHHWLTDCLGQARQEDLGESAGLHADGTEKPHGFNLIEWEARVGERHTKQIFSSYEASLFSLIFKNPPICAGQWSRTDTFYW